MTDLRPAAAVAPDHAAELETHRTGLTAHCYRMLGSAFEADDAVQETMVRASPAFGQYKPAAGGRGYEPWSLQVLELDGDRIAGITFFLDTARLFPLFGLPPRLER